MLLCCLCKRSMMLLVAFKFKLCWEHCHFSREMNLNIDDEYLRHICHRHHSGSLPTLVLMELSMATSKRENDDTHHYTSDNNNINNLKPKNNGSRNSPASSERTILTSTLYFLFIAFLTCRYPVKSKTNTRIPDSADAVAQSGCLYLPVQTSTLNLTRS